MVTSFLSFYDSKVSLKIDHLVIACFKKILPIYFQTINMKCTKCLFTKENPSACLAICSIGGTVLLKYIFLSFHVF